MQNILPYDGLSIYIPQVFSQKESEIYFQELLSRVAWQNDVVRIFGREIITRRKMAWYAENGASYTYSGSTKNANLYTPELRMIQQQVAAIHGEHYNSCLLNYYENGEVAMGWHSDDEKELKPGGCIASVSFGASRKFVFKHKETQEKISVLLENGSALLMMGKTQDKWSHSLPLMKKCKNPRINLTFRNRINA